MQHSTCEMQYAICDNVCDAHPIISNSYLQWHHLTISRRPGELRLAWMMFLDCSELGRQTATCKQRHSMLAGDTPEMLVATAAGSGLVLAVLVNDACMPNR